SSRSTARARRTPDRTALPTPGARRWRRRARRWPPRSRLHRCQERIVGSTTDFLSMCQPASRLGRRIEVLDHQHPPRDTGEPLVARAAPLALDHEAVALVEPARRVVDGGREREMGYPA